MCGIAGILDYARPAEASREALLAMRRALAPRGPDGQGELFDGPIALGHTRLAIQDPEGGGQPYRSPLGRYVLVYNGELANADELRHSYAQEYPFQGHSDTEVVLAALVLDGPRALHRFSGMFAFFLWDRELQRGFAARDRLGVKPLLFSREDGQLRFASEAKALLAARRSRSVNVDALVEWALVPQLSGVERTPFAGIEVLPPGGLLEVDRGGIRISRWGRFRPASRVVPEEPLLDDVLRRIYVGTNTVAASDDVPTGVFLSGGLDSSLIAGAAQMSVDEMQAFTIRYEGQSAFDYAHSAITFEDDTPYAEEIAKDLELEHHLVDVKHAELAADLQRIAEIDCLIPAWEQELSQHRLARAAAERVKIVLVGDAADETHFGYHFLLDDTATRSSESFLARLGAPTRMQLLHPELRASRPLEALAGRCEDLVADAKQAWGTRDANILATTSIIAERWLPRLLHNGDVHTMAFGLEARVPFASNELVDLGERVAPPVGLKHGIEKWHLRQGSAGELPDRIRWRRKSALPKDLGAEPVYRAEAAKVLQDPPGRLRELLDLEFVRGLLTRPAPLAELERSMLFQTIVLAHWARRYTVG